MAVKLMFHVESSCGSEASFRNNLAFSAQPTFKAMDALRISLSLNFLKDVSQILRFFFYNFDFIDSDFIDSDFIDSFYIARNISS